MNRSARQLLLTISCLLIGAGAAFAEDIVIKGSTTVLPIAQAVLEAYMKTNPGVKISLSGGGSVAADIEKVSDIMKIAKYGIFGTPAMVVDGKVKSVGTIPKKGEILAWLGKEAK